MSSVKSYRDLQVWQKARELTSEIYRVTLSFPPDERFGLISQMRRAAVSVVSNIAEGSSKRSTKEFLRFLNIAYGSLCELETQLYVSQDMHYISEQTLDTLLSKSAELGRMLNALMNKLENKITELRTPNSLMPKRTDIKSILTSRGGAKKLVANRGTHVYNKPTVGLHAR